MRFCGHFFTLFIVMSCASAPTDDKRGEYIEPKIVPLPSPVVSLYTGKVSYQSFPTRLADGEYKMTCGQRKFPFVVKDARAQAYLIASYFSSAQKETCFFNNEKILTLIIKEFDYPKEKLNVAKGKVFYSKKDLKRIIAEKKIKEKIYLNSASSYLFDRPFVSPLNSYITSHYGNQRLFNNAKKSQHLGNDFRAKVGVKIPAANRGRVVFTGDLFFIGKVVVIDHGLDIFTVYGHLSKIQVQKGDVVKQGDIVGLSGMTGRVSGPHLHWGVKINGSWVDGFSLIEASQRQFASLN